MKNNTIILNTKYSSLQAVFFMFFGAMYSFASTFLLSKNITNSQIGVIFAFANILGVFIIPFISSLADKKNLNQILNLGAYTSLFMLTMTLLLLYPNLSTLAISSLFVTILALQTSLQPIVNVLGFKLSNDKIYVSFGLARSMGSLCYSIFCIAMGFIIETFGTTTVPISGSIILILMFTAFFSMRRPVCTNEMEVSTSCDIDQPSNFWGFASSNKRFLIICIGILGIFFSNGIFNSFLLQMVKNVDGTNKDLGAIYAFMAFLEIPTMLFFDKISKFFSYEKMLKIASFCFTMKIGICMIAKNVLFLYIAHLFQPVAFALFLPAMVHYIDSIMDKHDAVKGQGLFTSAVTVSYVLASVIGGFLLDMFGVFSMNLAGTILSFIGSIIIILSLNNKHS